MTCDVSNEEFGNIEGYLSMYRYIGCSIGFSLLFIYTPFPLQKNPCFLWEKLLQWRLDSYWEDVNEGFQKLLHSGCSQIRWIPSSCTCRQTPATARSQRSQITVGPPGQCISSCFLARNGGAPGQEPHPTLGLEIP